MPSYRDSGYMPNELYHFGIKGMKWGVRRYQNPDGTLTAVGKKRASERTQNEINELQRKIKKSDSNPLMRYTINDQRRGKIEYLRRQRSIQRMREKASDDLKSAKEAYKTNKTEKLKNKIRDARIRKLKSYLYDRGNRRNDSYATRMYEGSQKRFRSNGDKPLNAFVKAAGIGLVTSVAVKQLKRGASAALTRAGSKVVEEILKYQYNNPIYIVPDNYS